MVVPVLVAIAINWEHYAPKQTEARWSLPIGMFIAVGLIVLMYAKKVQVKTPFTALIIIFGLAIALDPIIADLKLLSGIALAGSFIDYVFLRGAIADTEETIHMTKEAKINAQAMIEAQNAAKFSGRV
jgi:hypothetical protein